VVSTQLILLVHSGIVASLLLFWLLQLWRRGLFRWTTTGFWAWAACLLYFVLNPIGSLLANDVLRYDVALSIAGGERRAAWIGLVTCVGISTFFLIYLRTRTRPLTWRLERSAQLTPFIWFTILLAISLALPSLAVYRAGLFGGTEDVVIDLGRFSGDVTGYQYSAHMLLLVPAVFLVLSKSIPGRVLGWLSLALYVVLSVLDPWGRYLVVSALLAVTFIDVVGRRKNWPRVLMIVAVIFVVTLLRVRGHASFESRSAFLDLAAQVPENIVANLGSGDSAMLATWYLESFTKDTLGGYDYGIPIVNYSLTGLLPSKYFPWKYFLIDSLKSRQDARIGLEIHALLYGGKSSLLGSFYAEGGLLAVFLLSAITGFLMRKMDGMVSAEAPPLVLATGIVWMSLLWMIWGSADYWAITNLGIIALPAIGLWLVSPKVSRKQSVEPANQPGSRQLRARRSTAARPFMSLRGDPPK